MGKKKKKTGDDRQRCMFEDHATLPIFSGTPPRAVVDPFLPRPASSQGYLPGLRPGWAETATTGEGDLTAPLLFEVEDVPDREDAGQEEGIAPAEDETGEEEA